MSEGARIIPVISPSTSCNDSFGPFQINASNACVAVASGVVVFPALRDFPTCLCQLALFEEPPRYVFLSEAIYSPSRFKSETLQMMLVMDIIFHPSVFEDESMCRMEGF